MTDEAALRAQIARSPDGFVMLEPAGDERLAFAFVGPLHGKEVIWHCELRKLTRGPNYIEIAAEQGTTIPLRIGLKLPALDRAAILKTLIMIRNYKRLRPGRHEFGADEGNGAPSGAD